MFGRLMIEPVVQVDPTIDLETAVAKLINVTENVEIVRGIEFPESVLLFLLVPGDPDSGAVYILDRKNGIWYAIDFEDDQFGEYSVSQLETLLKDCNFLHLMERLMLFRSDWVYVVDEVWQINGVIRLRLPLTGCQTLSDNPPIRV